MHNYDITWRKKGEKRSSESWNDNYIVVVNQLKNAKEAKIATFISFGKREGTGE